MKNAPRRMQSAMEYLMTYGWSILIIAIVLGALFQLGIFSGIASPRAQPGSCMVDRASGPGSAVIGITGVCQGLEPQFVAKFSSADNQYVSVLNFTTGNIFSVSLWVNPQASQLYTYPGFVGHPTASSSNTWLIYMGSASYFVNFKYIDSSGVNNDGIASITATPGKWQNIVFVFDGGQVTSYLNGVEVQSQTKGSGMIPHKTTLDIAKGDSTLDGEISNVQIYNISLSANEVQALYVEGIGGAPIRPQNITGWWPLNGDTNDYSGNNYDGASSSALSYTSSWTSSYTPP